MSGATSTSTATRFDPMTGAREDAMFFGEDELLFACTYLPAGEPTAGVLVCSPVASEFEKNYRREVLLAWALAGRGIAVARLHYRGVGHSDGEAIDLSIDRMIEDARRGASRLLERTGVPRIAVAGTRLAALVAAAVARDYPEAPLALWEPVLAGEQYFREVFRAGFIGDLRSGRTRGSPSQAAMVERLHADGWVDVLGHTVGLPLYRSAVGRFLDDELDGAARPILLMQLSRGQSLRPPFRDAAARWRERGCDVQVSIIDEAEAWWFGVERRGKAALTMATAEWLAGRLAPGAAS